ncbi:hypothetical protein GCM10028807_63050 [Spirosoma daeguense]
MIPHYDAFPELAATILDWWETGALAINICGLVINFFFTMHKGARYRAAFVVLLLTLITLLYVDVITPANKHIQYDDMVRPIMYSAWAYTVWTRAWIYLEYFVQLKGQYDATIEQVLSTENTVVPWKEVAQYSIEMEKWQKWITGIITACFAAGLLHSQVDRIEALQVVSIKANQTAVREVKETKELALQKRHQDSLLLASITKERQGFQSQLEKLDKILQNSTTNQDLLRAERKEKRRQLEALQRLEQSVNARLVPTEPLPSTPPKFGIDPKKVKPYTNKTSFAEEVEPDTTYWARNYPE